MTAERFAKAGAMQNPHGGWGACHDPPPRGFEPATRRRRLRAALASLLRAPAGVGHCLSRAHCACASTCHLPGRSPGLFHQPGCGGGGRETAAGRVRGHGAGRALPTPCCHGARPCRAFRWCRCPESCPPAAGRAWCRSLGERVPRPSRRGLVSAASVEPAGAEAEVPGGEAARTGDPAGYGRLSGEGLAGRTGAGLVGERAARGTCGRSGG